MKNPDLIKPITDTVELSRNYEPELASDAPIPEVETLPESNAGTEPQNINDALIADLKRELAQEQERRLRILAEYENYRRRTQTEFKSILENAGERILIKLLPLLDDFERLRQLDKEHLTLETVLSGIELIERKLEKLVRDEGASPLIALGQPFNVQEHEAVAELPDAKNPPGTVLAELEKGWKLNGKVLRHSKVIISKSSVKCEPEADDG